MTNSSLPVMLVKNDTQQGKVARRAQLRSIIKGLQKAEFPNDYNRFAHFSKALREETSEGVRIQNRWLMHVSQNLEVPGTSNPPTICPPAILLPLLKADLAGAEVRRWENLTAGLPSPKRKQASNEPVPATSARLMEEAQREEEIAVQKLRNELDGSTAFMAFQNALTSSNKAKPKKRDPKFRQKLAQWDQDYTPGKPTIGVWSQPMSVADYVEATGRNRKTIERWLKRVGAVATNPGQHAADPDRYDAACNLNILTQWISSKTLTSKHAGGLAAATIAYTCILDPKFVPDLLAAINPVIKSRGLKNEVLKMFEEHNRLYSPPPDPFNSLLATLGSASHA